jgi:hypothetical protein
MKNSTFALFVLLAMSLNLGAQGGQPFLVKQHGLTIAPIQAFTKKGELQIGYERQFGRRSALELGIGFRFKGSDDPGVAPYNHEQFVETNYLQVQDGVIWLFFIPIISEGKDVDWEAKTEKRKYFTNSNLNVSAGYKCYLVPLRSGKVAGGLYFTPSLTWGKKNVSEYIYAQGSRGDLTELGSDFNVDGLPFLFEFMGKEKLMQEDIYEFDRLEIRRHDKPYLTPHLKLGYQLPIGRQFSADLGVRMGLPEPMDGSKLRIEPALKLAAWF